MKQYFVESVVMEMSAIGGILIIAMGLKMLQETFMPPVYFNSRTVLDFKTILFKRIAPCRIVFNRGLLSFLSGLGFKGIMGEGYGIPVIFGDDIRRYVHL